MCYYFSECENIFSSNVSTYRLFKNYVARKLFNLYCHSFISVTTLDISVFSFIISFYLSFLSVLLTHTVIKNLLSFDFSRNYFYIFTHSFNFIFVFCLIPLYFDRKYEWCYFILSSFIFLL